MGTNYRDRNRNDRNEDNRPWGNAFHVVDNGEDKPATWIKLGPVWRIKGGLRILLETLPVSLFSGGATVRGMWVTVQERKDDDK